VLVRLNDFRRHDCETFRAAAGAVMSGTGWSCPTCQARDESPCRDSKGRIRRDHSKRRLLAGAATLLEQHTHRLPLDDRLRLAASLLASECEAGTGSTATLDDGQAEPTAPHWYKLWQRLLTAWSIIEVTRRALAQPDSGLRLGELDTDLRNLEKRLKDAHELCCAAPRLGGLVVPPGIDLTDLERLVAIYHLEQVNAGLRHRTRAPEDTTQDWVITYPEHGTFIARAHQPTTDLTEPEEVRGFASTPLAAADLISQWFTGVATARITFDPPAPKQLKLATFTPVSDDGGGFQRDQRVLQKRGPCYEQLRTACANARERLRGVEITQFLAQRAALLNDTDPQLPLDPCLPIGASSRGEHHVGWLDSACWVATRLIVSTGCSWGEFGDHRPEVPGQITKALSGNVDLDQFLMEFFGGGPIDLIRVSAWAGPLYQLGSNGTHRIHTAAMLELPWLCATVGAAAIATEFDLISLCGSDIDNPLPWYSDDNYDQRVSLLTGMIRRGIIDGEIVGDDPSRPHYSTRLRCRYLPAPWLVRNPQHTVRVNTIYESRYPGALAQLGIPIKVGTRTDNWIEWLTSPDPSAG
jgi:hypothetical protein